MCFILTRFCSFKKHENGGKINKLFKSNNKTQIFPPRCCILRHFRNVHATRWLIRKFVITFLLHDEKGGDFFFGREVGRALKWKCNDNVSVRKTSI